MSYIVLPDGIPDFNQAVISFWFRVPADTLVAAATDYKGPDSTGASPPFDGIVPLVVFGPDDVNGYQILSGLVQVGTYTTEAWWKVDYIHGVPQGDAFTTDAAHNGHGLGFPTYHNKNVNSYVLGARNPKNPCYIGIDTQPANSQIPTPLNTLRINLQMSNMGTGSGRDFHSTSIDSPSLIVGYMGAETDTDPIVDRHGTIILMSDFTGHSAAPVVAEYNPVVINVTYGDATQDVGLPAESEWFYIALQNIKVMPDVWHHVLVSFDLESMTARGMQQSEDDAQNIHNDPRLGSIMTNGRIYVAYDDVNYKGNDLIGASYDATGIAPPGDNDLFSQNAALMARYESPPPTMTSGPYLFNPGYFQTTITGPFSRPAYSYTPGNIRSAGYAFGIPATPGYVSSIRHVEMAEFQMFTGVTLDTSIEANRRMFITADGRPADPAANTSSTTLVIGDPTTWEPGADINLQLPNSGIAAGNASKVLGKPVVDFTRSSQNWIQGNNLGSAKGTVATTGKIKPYFPSPQLGK